MAGTTPIPARLLTRLRAICLALPGASEEPAWIGVRWMVRQRNFAHLLRIEDHRPPVYARAAGGDGVVLTLRAEAALADGFRDAGAPYFYCDWGTNWGTKVIGVHLGARIDWPELETLIGESHRLLAGKRR